MAQRFYEAIGEADALLISFAEHNGSYTAAYKNIFDWSSRIGMKVFQDTPTLMLSASPGPGGGARVLQAASGAAPYSGADLQGSLSIPRFHEVFDRNEGRLRDEGLAAQLEQLIEALARRVEENRAAPQAMAV